MISLLVYFVVVCVILWAIKYIVPMPPPFDKVYYVGCVLVALVFLVYVLQSFGIMHVGHLPRLQ